MSSHYGKSIIRLWRISTIPLIICPEESFGFGQPSLEKMSSTILNHQTLNRKSRLLRVVSLVLLLLPYILYVGFIIGIDQGPVDYETFMDIGQRLIDGGNLYGENSYYPLPYVLIFAFFSWLPRPLSMIIWFLVPPLTALALSGWNPVVLVFAPLLSHFLGGQTAFLGMLGFWGYRKFSKVSELKGGFLLGLTLLKPQLAIVPLGFAFYQWWKDFYRNKRIPRQAWAWAISLAIILLPSFLIRPAWMAEWLGNLRPLAERAMAGIVPRTLLLFNGMNKSVFWIVLGTVAILIFLAIWRINHMKVTLDLAMLWGFIVSPLIHDYDLIQLVPLLVKSRLLKVAILLSIPGWMVMVFAYSNDSAWFAFTIIAPGLLTAYLLEEHKQNLAQDREKTTSEQ